MFFAEYGLGLLVTLLVIVFIVVLILAVLRRV
jgi:hypothetical protein